MIILFGVTTFVLYLVLFRMAKRGRQRSSASPKRFSRVPADSAANPRAVVGDDAVLIGEPAWTALDDTSWTGSSRTHHRDAGWVAGNSPRPVAVTGPAS